MTKRFLDSFRTLIGFEGEYSTQPADRGGETKYGISKKSYPNRDIANLTLEDAKAIYYVDFWHALRLDEVEDDQVAFEIFDTAVNCGTRTAARIAQKALKFLGSRLEVDGIMGTRTISAINTWIRHDPELLHKALNGYQFIHYAKIIEADESQLAFSRGWLRRIQYYRRKA